MDWTIGVGLPFVLACGVPFGVQRAIGWWLDSGRGVATMLAMLFVLAAVFALLRPARPWRTGVAVAAGGSAGSAAVLFWIGPGTIWPIVLVIAMALSTAAALAGAGGNYLYMWMRRR